MSELLDALIEQRRNAALDYQKYLQQIVELTKKVKNPTEGASYPKSLNTAAKRALYDNLGKSEGLALAIDRAVLANKQDDWRGNKFKVKKVSLAIKAALESYKLNRTGESSGAATEAAETYGAKNGETMDELVERILELVKNQNDY
jgi:type I restriction enzyme R subunit